MFLTFRIYLPKITKLDLSFCIEQPTIHCNTKALKKKLYVNIMQ